MGVTEKIGGMPLFGGKRSCLKRIGGYDTGKERVKVSTLLLSNDKNNVIAENVYIKLFLVFKLQVWSIGHTFRD